MYTTINFKTKKALKDAVAAGQQVTVYQPNQLLRSSAPPGSGSVQLEGPHFPAAHTWYAKATLKDGVVIKVS